MHEHEHEHDHDHEHEHTGAESDHVLWTRDRLRYTSVGIDIGSATTQVVFTDIEMRRLGRELSSRYVPVMQTVLYASPIRFTPYLDEETGIDADAVVEFVRESYREAGQTPEGVLAGVVLLTGNALLQHNARSLAERLATVQGDFVCHGAGHDMESRISAHGSGAVAVSRERQATVLNIDIGGGTTKLAMVKDGEVVATAALGVGSRSVTLDATGGVITANPVASATARALGIDLAPGAHPSAADLSSLAEEMIAGVGDVIKGGQARSSAPLLTPSFPAAAFDLVVAAGGVAEYLVNADSPGHGDLGSYLGAALARLVEDLGQPLHLVAEPIRATVLGSARDTVQLSGNTVFVSDLGTLPKRNVPVIDTAETAATPGTRVARVQMLTDRLQQLAQTDVAEAVAFSIDWKTQPTQRLLVDTLESIIEAVSQIDAAPLVVLLLQQDLAQVLGQIAKHELGLDNELVCIDGISTEGLDYIDIAALDKATSTLQVTMKSLLFGSVRQ